MALLERQVVFKRKSGSNTVMEFPVTRVEYVEGGIASVNNKTPDSNQNVQLNTLDTKSTNPITAVSDDTAVKWVELGAGEYWFNRTSCITDQPAQYGFLMNRVTDAEVFQLWKAHPTGAFYYRTGNTTNGWTQGWIEIAQASAIPTDYVTSLSVSEGKITYNKKNGAKGITTITNLPVANGGTGANNAEDALANLGIDVAITGLSVSGKTITYTRKNGTSGVIQTQVYNDSTLRYLIDENKFSNYSLGRAFNFGLLWLCVELFENTVDVDTSVGAGASIENYYDSTNHIINKTGVGYIVLQSLPQTCTKNNADVWAYADWEGTGSVKIEVSRDGGTTFTEIVSDSLTSISSQPSGTAMVCRLTLTGEVILKNVAWGCK